MSGVAATPAGPAGIEPTAGWVQPEPPETPPSLVTAVRFMYLGAVLSLVTAAVSAVAGAERMRTSIEENSPQLSAEQVNLVVWAGVAAAVLIGVVSAVLWVWMARKNGRGRGWARVVSIIFFAVNTIALANLLLAPGTSTATTRLLTAAGWLAGLGAIVFMFRRDSREYYRSVKERI